MDEWSGYLLEPIETQGREMTRHRYSLILLTWSLTFLAALAVAPGSALAGSLLSGYGGPGSGAQALLGSTLVNGAAPPGGGSSTGAGAGNGSGTGVSGGSGLSSGSGSVTTNGRAGARGAGTGAAKPAGSGGAHRYGGQGTATTPGASAGGPSAYTSSGSPRTTAALADVQDAGSLGLTGADVALFAMALGLLAATAGLTRRLARTQH